MAVTAMWQNQYALSTRKGPLDLSKLVGTGSDNAANVDIASHANDGDPTSDSIPTADEVGGDQHFQSLNIDGAQGHVMGQRSSATACIFGMPVIGNPDFSTGQEWVEMEVSDGWAGPRVGDSGAEASDIYRGGQRPSASFDFIPSNMALISAAGLFFQHGSKEKTTDLGQKYFSFPTSSDGSDPLYYGSFLRKMSATSADSRLLSDGVGTSFRMRGSQTEPLTCSLGLNGRILVTDANATAIDGATADADFTLDAGKRYLLTDMQMTFFDGTGHVLLPVESFDISCTAEQSYNAYNTKFPLNIVMGAYGCEGSITIPASAKGTFGLDADALQKLFADAGQDGAGNSSAVDPRQLTLLWEGTQYTDSLGDRVTARTVLTAAKDIQVKLNLVVTDVTLGGDTEATVTVAFRAYNTFTPAGSLERPAIQICTEDGDEETWGFEAASDPYTTWQA
jgi:hypothetical protein